MSATIRPDELTVERDLEHLRGDDEALARDALDRLWQSTRPLLIRRLGRLGVRGDDAEDQAQRSADYLWRHRRAFRAQTTAEWQALCHRTLRRSLRTEWDARSKERAALADVPRVDKPYVDAYVTMADEIGRIYAAADRLWLGEPRCDRPLVAAAAVQQVLLEGVSESDAAAMFGVGEEEIDAWMRDSSVLARVFYSSLCWPGDALAGHVLRPERPFVASELDSIEDADLPRAWTGPQARVVVLRARNGLKEEEIAFQAGASLGRDSVARVLERYRDAIPFRSIAERLLAAVGKRHMEVDASLGGLWKRVAFQYSAVDDLPHLQIVERTQAPAEASGARIDMATLNNWLSMRRLYAQLAARLVQEDL